MWSNLPFDLLTAIFSYLPPDSLATAKSTCRNWRAAADFSSPAAAAHLRHPPWFLAAPSRGLSNCYYAHNPITHNWHVLPLDTPTKPIATINGLVLAKFTARTSLKLAIINPFTRQSKSLPELTVARTNPAVGLVDLGDNSTTQIPQRFKIYVAGGMSSESSGGGAKYQPTVEAYDSTSHEWATIIAMPVELAVRLTVWTPNESVYSNGTLFWMTSARAYSVMGFEIETHKWRELSVPMADRLEFAALVPRTGGRLGVVGGTSGPGSCFCGIWELGEDDGEWRVVGKLPLELGTKLLGDKPNWGCVKCVGINGAFCLYRDFGSGFVIYWKGWEWIEGCHSGFEIKNAPTKGLLLNPNLGYSAFCFG